MSQTIFFENLSLQARIGTGEEERRIPQRLLSSGAILLEGVPWENDSIAKTVDYDQLLHKIVTVSAQSEFYLLERLGEHIIDHLMELYPGIADVSLDLWKDPCPVPLAIGRVGVTIHRDRMTWEKNRNNAKVK